MKRYLLLLLSFMVLSFAKAQSPEQMFWALNKNTYILDQFSQYPASVAYSVRKLRAEYNGPVMRIRRQQSGTDPEADVYFDSKGEMSASSTVLITKSASGYSLGSSYSLASFISGASVYVTIWYDQSGNSRDVAQTTSSRQPRIANSGTLETSSSHSSVRFINSSSTYLQLSLAASSMFASGRTGTLSSVIEASSGTTSAFGYADGGSNRWQVHLNESGIARFDVGNAYSRITASNSTYQSVLATYAFIANSSLMQIWRNGSVQSSSSSSVSSCSESTFYLGAIPTFPGSWYHDDHISEVIIFNVAFSSAETNILNTNQSLFFGL